jgi:hypothetical protein
VLGGFGGVGWVGGGAPASTGWFCDVIVLPSVSGPPSTGVQGMLRLLLQSTRS